LYSESNHCTLVLLYVYVDSLLIVYDNLPHMQYMSNKRVAPCRDKNISPKHVAAWYNEHKLLQIVGIQRVYFPFPLAANLDI